MLMNAHQPFTITGGGSMYTSAALCCWHGLPFWLLLAAARLQALPAIAQPDRLPFVLFSVLLISFIHESSMHPLL
jgi:hypothetical protein